MFPEKPKRHARMSRHVWIRVALATLIGAPLSLAFLPRVTGEQLNDFIAITIMIPAAVYLLYRGALWLIATVYHGDDTPQ